MFTTHSWCVADSARQLYCLPDAGQTEDVSRMQAAHLTGRHVRPAAAGLVDLLFHWLQKVCLSACQHALTFSTGRRDPPWR